jgi:hypothetical protein
VLRAQEDTQPVAGPPPPKPAAADVEITSAAAFDPQGKDGEHDSEAPRAIDNDLGTVWTTENYSRGGGLGSKSGVGLYVTARQPIAASRLDLWTRTPGFDVSIYGASRPGQTIADWGRAIKKDQVDHQRVRIPLDTGRSRFKYYLIWITKLPSENKANIAEVNLLGRT